MTDHPDDQSTPPTRDTLLGLYDELQQSVLDADDVVEFLRGVSALAASLGPDTSCGVTLDQYPAASTVVSSDPFALTLDEIQYGFGQGPCLEAMATNTEVAVPDLAGDDRWPLYRERAVAAGARSSVSFPMSLDAGQPKALGAVNVYSTRVDAFGDADVVNLRAFTRQAGIALTLMTRHAQQVVVERDLREAVATRAVIDQALGILMGQQRIPVTEAWELLRKASSLANRKMGDIAADLILSTTGQPPSPPRPFADPR